MKVSLKRLAHQIGGSQFHEPCCLPSHEVRRHNAKSVPQSGLSARWGGDFNYDWLAGIFKPVARWRLEKTLSQQTRKNLSRLRQQDGQLVMMLQEEVKSRLYFRCYSIDQRNVSIMP